MLATNIFIIGVHRSGTTSLFRYLSEHESVVEGFKKELHFFTPSIYEHYFEFNESKYNSFFPESNGVKLEASPSYFYGKNSMIELLSSSFKHPKFVLVLRNPVDRFISFYRHYSEEVSPRRRLPIQVFIQKSIEEYEANEIADTYLNRGIREGVYADYLEDWLVNAGEDLIIVDFDKFRSNPKQIVNDVLEFCELERVNFRGVELSVHNESRVSKNYFFNVVARSVNSKFENFFARNKNLKNLLKKAYSSINGSQDTPLFTPDIDAELQAFYLQHNSRLKVLLQKYDIPLFDWLTNIQ